MKFKSDLFKLTLSDKAEVELCFIRPTHDEMLQMDLEYRRIYSIALRDGIMTGTEAVKRLKESGGWDDEDDEQLSNKLLEMNTLEKEVTKIQEENADVVEDEKLAGKVILLSKVRNEVMQIMTAKTNVFEQTCEGIAEDQKRYKYIALCTMRDNERFFEDYDNFKSFLSKEDSAGSELYRRAFFYLHDIDEDPSQDWAEVKYLKKKQEKLKAAADKVDKAQKAADKAKAKGKKNTKKKVKANI